MTVGLDALILPAFTDLGELPAETAPWEQAYEFTGEIGLAGLTQPLRYTEDGLGIVPTGVGKTAAATTTTALLTSPKISLADTLVLSVGVAGAPPSIPVGSVLVSDCIVDWDDKCRFPDEIAANPYTEEQGYYKLDPGLVAEIERVGSAVTLGGNHSRLLRGTNLCGDELWHGNTLAEQADWVAAQYDAAPYRVTEMEDAGTAGALARFDRLDSYCAIRGVSNHDRPTGAKSPRESFFGDAFEDGFGLAIDNAVAVAQRVVEDLPD
ncbi:phosphorylase family protein [Halovenus halobia]|uniref:phosphorylase family protein n=1 Tax=Halovenus halobia TaxID=3396622 RepID=UPI003F570E3F